MTNPIANIHNFVFTGITILFFFQSIILFFRSKNNKARRTMAYIELIWGLVYMTTLILMNTVITEDEYALIREKVLIIGNFYIMFTHFFPIQVLLPGWLNWKRGFLLISPIILMTAIYYGGMFCLGESPEKLFTYSEVWSSIGHFNVWFRFIMLLSNLFYIAVVLLWLYKFEKRYIQWKDENYADQEYVDISWMRSYDFIILGIFLFYLGILFFGGRIPVICHSTFALICFSYLFYKALFYESPYPEDFYAEKTDNHQEESHEEYILPDLLEIENEQTFTQKIPNYTQMLKKWLEEEKPYLHNDFKLTDTAHILPLNRSYLSRIFNEGFGQSFSKVIRTYRIDYAKEIIKNYPDMPLHKIASLSGFLSDSSFTKAFKQVAGTTPKQYRSQFLGEATQKE